MKWKMRISLLLLCFISFYACVKVDDDISDMGKKVDLKEGKWTQITNLEVSKDLLFKAGGVRTEEQDCTDKFFFSLETGKQVPSSEAFTGKWDFAIKLYYDKFLYINHQVENCPVCCQWVGSQGEPILCTLVAEDFEKVTEAPDSKEYLYNRWRTENDELIDKDKLKIVWGNQYQKKDPAIGYYYNTRVPEKGSYEGSGNIVVQMIPNRTFILRTTKGKWAKLQIQGIYKDAPLEATGESEPGYLTFRYYVQEDGSRNLDTR